MMRPDVDPDPFLPVQLREVILWPSGKRETDYVVMDLDPAGNIENSSPVVHRIIRHFTESDAPSQLDVVRGEVSSLDPDLPLVGRRAGVRRGGASVRRVFVQKLAGLAPVGVVADHQIRPVHNAGAREGIPLAAGGLQELDRDLRHEGWAPDRSGGSI